MGRKNIGLVVGDFDVFAEISEALVPWIIEVTRSKPMPVSTCLAGSSTKLPSGLALNWMKTRFQISMQRASPELTSSRPCFWLGEIGDRADRGAG